MSDGFHRLCIPQHLSLFVLVYLNSICLDSHELHDLYRFVCRDQATFVMVQVIKHLQEETLVHNDTGAFGSLALVVEEQVRGWEDPSSSLGDRLP